MRKLANLITAHIYILIVRKFTDQTKEEVLEGESIEKFGANLVFSSFVLMILIMISFYIGIWAFQGIVTLNQN